MKKVLKSLKIVIPIGLAIYLFWTTFKNPETRKEIITSINEVNYLYIIAMLVIVMLSHASRAYRWKFLLEPLGYKTKFSNSFFSIMIGYVVNMIIPRAGEISRAAIFSRVEKIPTEQAFGTIAAERFVDLIALALITFTTFYIERDTAWKNAMKLFKQNKNGEETSLLSNPILWIVLVATLLLLFFILRSPKIKEKLKGIASGLWEGISSIGKMKSKWKFLLHTVFIWGSYIFMFYLPFLSLDSTADISFNAIMVAFVFSAFAVVLTPGGTGAYHKAIGIAVGLYGYSVATGEAFGLIIWSAQAILNIVVGLLSLYLINKLNENYSGHSPAVIQ